MNAAIPRVLHIHFGKADDAEQFFGPVAQFLGERGTECYLIAGNPIGGKVQQALSCRC